MEQDKQDKSEVREATLPQARRVYTYEDLIDPEIFSFVSRRLVELHNKSGGLTIGEVAELNDMYPAWFKHMFDPI